MNPQFIDREHTLALLAQKLGKDSFVPVYGMSWEVASSPSGGASDCTYKKVSSSGSEFGFLVVLPGGRVVQRTVTNPEKDPKSLTFSERDLDGTTYSFSLSAVPEGYKIADDDKVFSTGVTIPDDVRMSSSVSAADLIEEICTGDVSEDEDIASVVRRLNERAAAAILTGILPASWKMRASRYALKTSTDGTIYDESITTIAPKYGSVDVTFPRKVDGIARDFIIRIEQGATPRSVNFPAEGLVYEGDEFPAMEANTCYLIYMTETSADRFFVKVIVAEEVK